MKYKLYLRNVNTDPTDDEFIKESDSYTDLVDHVKNTSIYNEHFKNGWPMNLIQILNEVRNEVIIGHNKYSDANLHGTIRSLDDHKYDYVITGVDKKTFMKQ